MFDFKTIERSKILEIESFMNMHRRRVDRLV